MSKHLEPKIKQLQAHDGAVANKAKTELIGTRLSASGNVTVAAQGPIVSGGSSALQGSIVGNTSAHMDAKTATGTMKTKNSDAVKLANAGGVVLMQQFPNQPDVWRTYGYETTMEEVPDTVKPGIVENCSVSQGDFLGTGDVHHDPTPTADTYTVLVTNGPADDYAKYIDVTNTDESTAKSSTTVTLPSTHINVPLFFIVIAHNSDGDGPPSVPFGGGRRIQ